MKYQVIMLYRSAKGNHSSVIGFNSEDAAKAAASDFFDAVSSIQGATPYCRVFHNPQTVESIFLDLLKANPYGDVTQLMNQAEAALKLLESKK